ncbi:MAG: right-handed parallel beta-helix repeat-containing protein [Haloarculaceae archaeon]
MDDETDQSGSGDERAARRPAHGDGRPGAGVRRVRGERLSRRDFLRTTGVSLTALTAGCPGEATTDSPRPTEPPTRTQVAGTGRAGTVTPRGTPRGSGGSDPSPTETDTDVYVAPNGRADAPGTQAAPLGDLSRALDRTGPGTTVWLGGGTYRYDRTVGTRGLAGTADAPVVVAPEPGERPVFDFESASVGGLRFSECRHLVLRGFAVRNAPSRGLFVEDRSSDVVVEDVTVGSSGGDPDASGAGVFVLDSESVTLRRVRSQNNYDPSSGGSNADGIGIETSPDSVVESCVARGNSDDGFDLWQATGVTLWGCLSSDNGYDPNGDGAGDGNGFKLGGGDRSGDNVVRRCVAFDNRERGFDDNGATSPVTLHNCTAWRNPIAFRLGCDFDGPDTVCPAHHLRNNLSVEGALNLSPFVDSAANSWELGIADPEFASTDRDRPDFLHLSAGSPAIDAGVDVGLSYRGEAPDLGAYKFRPNPTPTEPGV